MTEKTLPLVPADVDLRGYEFMPLYGHHLFGSAFNSSVSDAGWRAAMTLWWAAWNQVPAASLPNDDVALTRLADLGRDTKAFRKVKAEALHGFVECSDGRLYHKALGKWALEAWDRRVKERQRKATWRAGKHRDKDGTEAGTTTGHSTGQRRDVPVEGKGSEVKRSEAKGSDIENRDSVVTQPSASHASGGNGKVAVENTVSQPRKGGQDWDDAAYVAATAKALGVDRRKGERDADFKDRVYEAVQAKLRAAKASIGHRAHP